MQLIRPIRKLITVITKGKILIARLLSYSNESGCVPDFLIFQAQGEAAGLGRTRNALSPVRAVVPPAV